MNDENKIYKKPSKDVNRSSSLSCRYLSITSPIIKINSPETHATMNTEVISSPNKETIKNRENKYPTVWIDIRLDVPDKVNIPIVFHDTTTKNVNAEVKNLCRVFNTTPITNTQEKVETIYFKSKHQEDVVEREETILKVIDENVTDMAHPNLKVDTNIQYNASEDKASFDDSNVAIPYSKRSPSMSDNLSRRLINQSEKYTITVIKFSQNKSNNKHVKKVSLFLYSLHPYIFKNIMISAIIK